MYRLLAILFYTNLYLCTEDRMARWLDSVPPEVNIISSAYEKEKKYAQRNMKMPPPKKSLKKCLFSL